MLHMDEAGGGKDSDKSGKSSKLTRLANKVYAPLFPAAAEAAAADRVAKAERKRASSAPTTPTPGSPATGATATTADTAATTMNAQELAAAITAAVVAAPAAAASVKLPGLWTTEAALWFARAEGAFATANITASTTKYSHVVQHLDVSTAAECRDLLTAMPANQPYETLKTAVLAACTASPAERVRKFQAISLGDLKPTTLLRQMRALQEDGATTAWYRQCFLDKLPVSLRLHLAANAGTLAELAAAADVLVDSLRLQPVQSGVLAVQETAGAAAAAGGEEDIDAALAAEVAAVYNKFGRKPQQQHRHQQQQQRPKTTTTTATNDTWCFFHRRFGPKAQKCRDPCTFKAAGKADGSHWPRQ